MIENKDVSGSPLGLRPATASDAPFLELLHRSTRPDLQLLQGTTEQIDAVVAQQYEVLQAGTAAHFPNAMHFVAEHAGQPIGGVVVDFGPNEVRLVYLALVPVVRGKGYGRLLLQGLQQAASRARAPLAVTVWRNNPAARSLYLELGFVVERSQPMSEQLVWYPDARPTVLVS